MSSHPWRECLPPPPTFTNPFVDAPTRELYRAATGRAWIRFDRPSKRLFHELVCLGRHTAERRAAVNRFSALVEAQAKADFERHRVNAGKVLEMMEQLGVTTKDPEPGEKVTVAVMRVTDSMAMGDDPYPELALRRTIVGCSVCGTNCWLDPNSHGQAVPIPTCLRCLDPKVGELLDKAITKQAARED